MKQRALTLLFLLTLFVAPGCSSLAKYEQPESGPYSATRAGWQAIEYCLYLRDPDPLCSVTQSFVFPGLLPLWIVNLGVAIPFDTLTLAYDLIAPKPDDRDGCSPPESERPPEPRPSPSRKKAPLQP
jgi:uncharacterized protein YceK